MKRPLLAALLGLVLLAALTGETKCQPENGGGISTGQKCDESCSLQPDTVTLRVIWYPVTVKGAADAVGEITWSKAGVLQTNEHHALNDRFKLWQGWEHDWRKQGYPQITLTGDTNSTPAQWGGVHCSLEWLNPDTGQAVILDYVNRGGKVGPGSVTCDSNVGLKHVNNK